MRRAALGSLLLLLAACGGAAGSGAHDPRESREPNWRDSSNSRDTIAPPRDIVREPHKDVKDYKGK